MKKLINEVLSLAVPMALVIDGINSVNTMYACLLGLLAIIVMVLRKHRHPFLSNGVISVIYLTLIYFGAKIYMGFSGDPTKFLPLMKGVAYLCLLGIIACVVRIIKKRVINHHRRALLIFEATFLLVLAIGAIQEIIRPCLNVNSNSLVIMLIISALGMATARYFITRGLA